MVSVIIPTHRRPQSLKKLLCSLIQQDFPDFEVLVVDNFFDPITKKEVTSFWPQQNFPLQYLYVGQLGVNRARNLGVQKAQGDHLVFLDDDCFIQDPHYLKKVNSFLNQNPSSVGVGGFYLLPPKRNLLETAYHLNSCFWLKQCALSKQESAHLLGGNMAFHKSLLVQHPFNEKIIYGGAEAELSARLRKTGVQLFLKKELSIQHHLKLNLLNLTKKAFAQGQGHFLRKSYNLEVKDFYFPIKNLLGTSSFQGLQRWMIIEIIRLYRFAFNVGHYQAKKFGYGNLTFLSTLKSIVHELNAALKHQTMCLYRSQRKIYGRRYHHINDRCRKLYWNLFRAIPK